MEEKHTGSDSVEGRETLHITFSTAYLVYDIHSITQLSSPT